MWRVVLIIGSLQVLFDEKILLQGKFFGINRLVSGQIIPINIGG
jgi:hypothetical protein